MTINLSFFWAHGDVKPWMDISNNGVLPVYSTYDHVYFLCFHFGNICECTHPSITLLFLLLQNPLWSSYKKGIAASRNS